MITALMALALAGIPFNCGNGFPDRAACYRVTCAGGTCTEGAPVASDFAVDNGYIQLSNVASWAVTACADSGQTLVGAGELHVYGVNPWDLSTPWRNKSLDLQVSAVTSATACAGAPCRCATWGDQETLLRFGRRLKIIASGVTVSSGNLTIYLYGKVAP